MVDSTRALSILAATMLAFTAAANATAPAVEGNLEETTCYVLKATFLGGVDGHTAASYDSVGTPARSAGQLGYRANLHCIGLVVASGSESGNRGACVMADPDGDRVFTVYSGGESGPGVWRATGGTGKYLRIQAEGTFEEAYRPDIAAASGPVQYCTRESARWKLR